MQKKKQFEYERTQINLKKSENIFNRKQNELIKKMQVKELITNGFIDRVTEDEIQHIEVKIVDQETQDIIPTIEDFCKELRSIVNAYIAKLVIDEDVIADESNILSAEEAADYLEENYSLEYKPDFYSIEILKSKNDEEDV